MKEITDEMKSLRDSDGYHIVDCCDNCENMHHFKDRSRIGCIMRVAEKSTDEVEKTGHCKKYLKKMWPWPASEWIGKK